MIIHIFIQFFLSTEFLYFIYIVLYHIIHSVLNIFLMLSPHALSIATSAFGMRPLLSGVMPSISVELCPTEL